jgi:hypothetical protein
MPKTASLIIIIIECVQYSFGNYKVIEGFLLQEHPVLPLPLPTAASPASGGQRYIQNNLENIDTYLSILPADERYLSATGGAIYPISQLPATLSPTYMNNISTQSMKYKVSAITCTNWVYIYIYCWFMGNFILYIYIYKM